MLYLWDTFPFNVFLYFRILETTRAKWKEECDINDEYEESSVARKESFAIEREYDGMPQLERLTIHVEQDVPLKPLGSVVSVVDCLGKWSCASSRNKATLHY